MKKVMKLFCRPQSRKCNNRYNRNKHVFQYLLCPTSGFMNLTTTDILDQIILCCRTVLCSVGCLPSTLAPERYHASGSIHPPHPKGDSQKCLQTFSNILRVTKSPTVGNHSFKSMVLDQIKPWICQNKTKHA